MHEKFKNDRNVTENFFTIQNTWITITKLKVRPTTSIKNTIDPKFPKLPNKRSKTARTKPRKG